MRKFRKWMSILLTIFAILIISRPYLITSDINHQYKEIKKIIDEHQMIKPKNETIISNEIINYEALLNEMKTYNKNLILNGQILDEKDQFTDFDVNLSEYGYVHEAFGYIEISAMSLKMPLYLGASKTHLDQGAAVLAHTSFPIGGINTNSVIAGHRGCYGAPYFKEIELLKEGDLVKISNPWETLWYCVKSTEIIEPWETEQIKIQKGKDMITLLTCHPYMSNGKYRYLVYCERVEDFER